MLDPGWRVSGSGWEKASSFYFPSISFLSGFPSAFPLILKRERSLSRELFQRRAAEELRGRPDAGWDRRKGERETRGEKGTSHVELGRRRRRRRRKGRGGSWVTVEDVCLVFHLDLLKLPISLKSLSSYSVFYSLCIWLFLRFLYRFIYLSELCITMGTSFYCLNFNCTAVLCLLLSLLSSLLMKNLNNTFFLNFVP